MKTARHITPFATLIMAVTLLILSSGAAQAAMVKPAVEVDSPFILLSDVLINADIAGNATSQRIALAPEPGNTTNVPLHVIETTMRKAGMADTLTLTGGYITVRRKGTEIPRSLLETRIEDAIKAKDYSASPLAIRITGVRGSLYLPSDSDMHRIRIENLSHDARSNRFSAEIVAPYDQNAQLRTHVSGVAEPVMEVPVLARSLERGEVVSAALIDWTTLPERRINRTMILDEDTLIGMEALRPLKAGQPLRSSDLRRPLLVEKGSLVTMVVQRGALSLSATGKAMQDGSKGDIIRLMNISTNRIIEAQVTGAGSVSVLALSTIASR